DFGNAMLRQLFLDIWLGQVWQRLSASPDDTIRGVAEKAVKENAYHRRHSSAWVIRLGDGTDESHRRMIAALDELWPYAGEIADDEWYDDVHDVLRQATLLTPDSPLPRFDGDTPSADGVSASDRGERTALVELLSEAQSLARAHPGATW